MASGLLKVEPPANNGTGLVPGRLSLSSDNLATGSRLGNGERGGSLTPNLPSMDRLSAPILTRRKFSFPANLHSTALLGFPEIGHRDGFGMGGSSLSASSTALLVGISLSNSIPSSCPPAHQPSCESDARNSCPNHVRVSLSLSPVPSARLHGNTVNCHLCKASALYVPKTSKQFTVSRTSAVTRPCARTGPLFGPVVTIMVLCKSNIVFLRPSSIDSCV